MNKTKEELAKDHATRLIRDGTSPDRFTRSDIELAYYSGYEAAALKWVKCSDRLPEETGTYLVFHEFGAIDTQMFSKVRKQWNAFDWDYPNAEENYMQGITHWMPLPEAPKEEHEKS